MEPTYGQQQMPTYEQRMEDYARRQASALETLRGFAWAWTIAAVILAALWLQMLYRG